MKNKMMRAASVLMVAVLLSTCAISGTFAKYVTSVTNHDEARVAKWNIGYNFDQKSTFAATYETNSATTVESANGEQVVAPGTNDSGTYVLTGTPEVDYKVTFDFEDNKEVFLKAQAYNYADEIYKNMDIAENELTENYIPLKWTVTLTKPDSVEIVKVDVNGANPLNGSATGVANEFSTMAAMEAAFDNTQLNYEANETAGITVVIAWTWAISQNDKADTILGYLGNDVSATNTMLNASLAADTDFCTTVSYDFTITATQVD